MESALPLADRLLEGVLYLLVCKATAGVTLPLGHVFARSLRFLLLILCALTAHEAICMQAGSRLLITTFPVLGTAGLGSLRHRATGSRASSVSTTPSKQHVSRQEERGCQELGPQG